MKKILDYISNNSFLTAMIGALSGSLFSFLTAIYVSRRNEKMDIKKEQRKHFENKAELRIVKSINNTPKPDIEVFVTPFKTEYMENSKHKIIFPKEILNTNKYKYKDFYLKNIGNADINYLDICVTSKRNTIMCKYSSLTYVIKNKIINYNFCYDRKILKNETICIRMYHLEEMEPGEFTSANFAILYEDSFGNLYKQPFWYQKENLYKPHKISYQDYRSYVTIDDALYCFDHPWMW